MLKGVEIRVRDNNGEFTFSNTVSGKVTIKGRGTIEIPIEHFEEILKKISGNDKKASE